MSAITPLCVALASLATCPRAPKAVAKKCRLPIEELADGLDQIHSHSWQGKLALALQEGNHPPELMPWLIELARIEQHYIELLAEHRRVRRVAAKVRRNPEASPTEILKFENLVFRVHQAAIRAARELQKTRLGYEKAAAAHAHAPSPIEKAPADQTDDQAAYPSMVTPAEPEPLHSTAPETPLSPPPTPREISQSHRAALRALQPHHRGYLLYALVRQLRESQLRESQLHQNGPAADRPHQHQQIDDHPPPTILPDQPITPAAA